MTSATLRLAAIIPAVLLGLTYLLLRGVAPDPARHERILQAIHQFILSDAALQRDALKARAGLLANYDPLVDALAAMRGAVTDLAIIESAGLGSEAGIGERLHALAADVAARERRVEVFKSDNALLHNSLAYVTRASRELGGSVGGESGGLVNAMLRFMQNPQGSAATDAEAALGRLPELPASPELQTELRMLAAHSRIILATLPEIDRVMAQVLATGTAPSIHELQGAYLGLHKRIEARAELFRVLLYIAAVLLLAYLGRVFWRLRANERALRARLDFEGLVTAISAEFVDLPAERLDAGIERALSQLGEHMAVDRAYLLLFGGNRQIEAAHIWQRPDVATPVSSDRGLRSLCEGLQPHGFAHVPRASALPPGAQRAALSERDVISWLCVPAGSRQGGAELLGFEAVRHEKHWSDDDVALLRTVGDILASATGRWRAEAERQALEARLRQSQRIEAVGTLAGGIAHDFNNILGIIQGYGEMALAAVPDWGAIRQHVEQMLTASRRAAGVVDQILTFSRRGERQRRPVQIEPVIQEAIGLLRASLPATVTIHARLEAGGAVMLSDPTQLQQVTVNLCTNAAQAMPAGGVIELTLDEIARAEELALSHGTLPRGGYARLAVRDTGKGMDAALIERIFEPFFTTKAAGEGTGLGLATVHGIVAESGGALDVRSRPGEGSVLAAYFPIVAAADIDDEPASSLVPYGHGETILLVEDERPLLLLGEEVLAALGYEPVGFDSTAAALQAFRAEPDRFDLVLTDQVMPEMTGTQLALALHELRPNLPIILVSGYAGPVHPEQLESAGIRELLKKPVPSRALALSLARHLRPPDGADGSFFQP